MFAQSFSKDLKLEFPRFEGENPISWLRQEEKCFALAETPPEKGSNLLRFSLLERQITG
jgi:hypothetical protein